MVLRLAPSPALDVFILWHYCSPQLVSCFPCHFPHPAEGDPQSWWCSGWYKAVLLICWVDKKLEGRTSAAPIYSKPCHLSSLSASYRTGLCGPDARHVLPELLTLLPFCTHSPCALAQFSHLHSCPDSHWPDLARPSSPWVSFFLRAMLLQSVDCREHQHRPFDHDNILLATPSLSSVSTHSHLPQH